MDQFIEALRGLDADVQQQFLDRFDKFKGLKRVMAASRQAFVRDVTEILGEQGAPLIPLVESFYETVSYETFEAAWKGEDADSSENAVPETTVVEEVETTNGHDEHTEAFAEQPEHDFPSDNAEDAFAEQHQQPEAEHPPATATATAVETHTVAEQAPVAAVVLPPTPLHLMPAAPQASFVDDETAQQYGGEPRVHVVKDDSAPAAFLLPENRSYNVWIGDLHPDATDDDVIQAFINMGYGIQKVRLFKDPATGKNKGWGFAHFVDKETMARMLQTDFDPPMVLDKKLKVGPAQERNIIFVGNLSFDTTWVEFFNAIVDCLGADKISAFELKTKDDGKCRGYGFVTCVDQNAADEGRRKLLAAKLMLHGREANISWADKEDEMTRDVKTMYLANLGDDISEETLREICGKYGSIDKIVVAKDMATGKAKGYAFVEYTRRLDCLKGIQALNNSEIAGRHVQASLVKRKTQPGMGGGFGGTGPRGRGRGFQQWGQGWGQQWGQGYGQAAWGAYPGYGTYGAQAYGQYATYPGYNQQAYAGYGQAAAGTDVTAAAAYGGQAAQGGYAQGYAQRPQGQNNRYQPY